MQAFQYYAELWMYRRTTRTRDSHETITLQLVRVPATRQPSRGSIIVNTGGPGLAQRTDITGDSGRAYQILTGGVYDLITFDPRGNWGISAIHML